MDHLDRPRTPVFPQLKIPYVCLQPYDGESFMSYPASQGYEKDQVRLCNFARRSEETSAAHERRTQYDNKPALQSFLQSWLFFGLLHELYASIGQSFGPNEFISDDTFMRRGRLEIGGKLKRLNTSKLQDIFISWQDLSKELDHENMEELCRHIDDCLSIVYQICSKLVNTENYIDEDLLISFMSLGNSVENGIRWVLKTFLDEHPPGANEAPPWLPGHRGWEPPQSLYNKLLYHGWCPNETEILRSGFSVNETVYASQMPRYGDRTKHRGCSKYHCTAANIDDATYKSKHHFKCPGVDRCPELRINYDVACRILEAGLIPVIRTTWTEDRLNMQITSSIVQDGPSMGMKLQYIAISHVWAHGLGNNAQNALPACQVLALHMYTSLIWRELRPGDTLTSVFWIDTLCVPVKPEHVMLRNKALARMAEIYRGAFQVLVLDEALMKMSSKEGNSGVFTGLHQDISVRLRPENFFNQKELTFAIMFSDWWRRLWTLQEGVLAHSLVFLLREGIVPLQLVISINATNHEKNWADIAGETLRSMLSRLNDYSRHSDRASRRRKVLKYLFNRSISRLGDEIPCLAMLMGLDVRHIADAPEADRAQQFYLALRKVPTGLVFIPGPKLKTPGFRWAASSFIGQRAPSSRSINSTLSEHDTYEAEVSEHGIEIEAQGYLLSSFGTSLKNDFYILPGGVGVLPDLELADVTLGFSVTAVCHEFEGYGVPSWNELNPESKFDLVLIMPPRWDLRRASNAAVLACYPREVDTPKRIWTAQYLCAVYAHTNSWATWTGDDKEMLRIRVQRERSSLAERRGHTGNFAWIKSGGGPISRWLIT